MTSEEVLKEFRELISDLNPKSDPAYKQTVFEFIQEAWSVLGECPEIREEVCLKLRISPQLFNIFIGNPAAVTGVENLHRLLKDGWLKTYIEYTIGNEAPEEFHLWVALTILGAAMRRSVFMDYKFYKFYPNLYTVLMSPPGVCRKTTAANIGHAILTEAIPELTVFSEKITPEALAKALAKESITTKKSSGGIRLEAKSQGLLFAPELTMFLGREQYNEPLVIFLTRLYDCAKETAYESIKHGKIPLHEVFVCLLGCTTPSELPQAIPQSASGGGFMSRLTLIYKTSSPRCFPIPVVEDPLKREYLVVHLRRLADAVSGQFLFSRDGEEWFIPYYMRWKNHCEEHGDATNSQREPDILLKLSMLMTVSEESGMLLTADILNRSYAILQSASMTTRDVNNMVDSGHRGKVQEQLYGVIRRKGGVVTRSVALQAMYAKVRNLREFDDAVNFLESSNLIKVFERARRPGARTSVHYRLTSIKEGFDSTVEEDKK